MDPNAIVCPVCTLFLRPGITLKAHLASHPKQKVIEALVRLTESTENNEVDTHKVATNDNASGIPSTSSMMVNQAWNQGNFIAPMQGNVFIYHHQSMTTTQPPPQYILPTVINHPQHPQMIPPGMMPYMYQQQQLMMSSHSIMAPPPPYIKSLEPGVSSGVILEELDQEEEHPQDPLELVQEDECDEFHEEEEDQTTETKSEHFEAVKNDLEVVQNEENYSTPQYEEVEEEEEEEEEEEVQKYQEDMVIEDNSDDVVDDENYAVDLDDKACQTQNSQPEDELQPQFYFTATSDELNQNQTIYTTGSAVLQSGDFIEMEGLHLMNLSDINEFTPTTVISQVEQFDSSTEPVLMTIGAMEEGEESSSISSNINIRSDEKMPPRGELSGPESMGGASDITWYRIQVQDSNSVGTSSWSNSHQELPNRTQPPETDDGPMVVGYSGPPKNFKCSQCEEAFTCLKDRREHDRIKHQKRVASNVTKRKKKLIIKPLLKIEQPCEGSFNFTNKLKMEEPDDEECDQKLVDKFEEEVEVRSAPVALDIKTMCSLCDLVLPSSKALKEHRVTIHKLTPQTRHKCSTCDEVFPNDYKFSEHLKVHPLECKMCGRLFYRRQNIQLHMRRHLGIKPYKCEVCEKSFLTKQKLDEHRNTHTGDAPIKCSLCDETFRRHSNLIQHRNRHHLNVKRKVRDYICFCHEIFHSKKKLAWHQEIHDAKPKACTQCNEKFIHMSSLTRHMRRAHNDRFLPDGHKSSENVECPICKGIYLKSSLDVHVRSHSGTRPFSCLICNKEFTTKWNLKLHKWTHASRVSKPYKCDQCKGAFIRESDYVAHMNSHKSVRPYTCNHCGAKFIRKYNCQRHVKEHEKEKLFECKVCGKSFHRSYYLKDHMRIHSGVRPFTCHICGKTSTTKSNHNKHVQIHHAREPVSTEH